MNFVNFIVWLFAGAIIGWFASRMVQIEQNRTRKPAADKTNSEKS